VYFFSLTTLLILLVRYAVAVGVRSDGTKPLLFGSIGSLVLLRIFMLWNRSGVKWSGLPSIARDFQEAITAKEISPKTVHMLGLLCLLILVSAVVAVGCVAKMTSSLQQRGTISRLQQIMLVSVHIVGVGTVTLFKLTEVLAPPSTADVTTQLALVSVLSYFAECLHYYTGERVISLTVSTAMLISAIWVVHAAISWFQLACVSQHSASTLYQAELFSVVLLVGIFQFCLVVHHPTNMPVTVGLAMLFLCF
jgi:hypothetical protein